MIFPGTNVDTFIRDLYVHVLQKNGGRIPPLFVSMNTDFGDGSTDEHIKIQVWHGRRWTFSGPGEPGTQIGDTLRICPRELRYEDARQSIGRRIVEHAEVTAGLFKLLDS